MSGRMIELVRRARLAPAGRHSVALALAERCDPKSGQVQITMASIAGQAGLSKVSARQHVHALIQDGVLSVLANAHGGVPGIAPVYRLHAQALESAASTPDLFGDWLDRVPDGGPYALELPTGEMFAVALQGRPGARELSFWRVDTEPGEMYGSVLLSLVLRDPRVREAWDGCLWPGNPLSSGEPVQLRPEHIADLQEWAQRCALGRVESVIEA